MYLFMCIECQAIEIEFGENRKTNSSIRTEFDNINFFFRCYYFYSTWINELFWHKQLRNC